MNDFQAVPQFFKERTWSILSTDGQGGAMLCKAGLSAAEARLELGCRSHVHQEFTDEMFIVPPPAPETVLSKGEHGVAHFMSGQVCLAVAGITQGMAEDIARQSMRYFGPHDSTDRPKVNAWREEVALYAPRIHAAWVVDVSLALETWASLQTA